MYDLLQQHLVEYRSIYCLFTALLHTVPVRYFLHREKGAIISINPRKEIYPGWYEVLLSSRVFLQIPINCILHSSFSNCSAVVLVFVSQRNTSSQQLLSLVLVSQPNSSSQQSDLAGRQGPKKARPWGSNRLRGTRESTASTTNISGTTNISRAASRTETSPRSNNSTTKIFSSNE